MLWKCCTQYASKFGKLSSGHRTGEGPCSFQSLRNFQFVLIQTVKGFSIVNETEVDAFLEFSCFFNDPTDVGNLMSGSSAFSKSSLYIWKFSVHILLKPILEDFVHDLASMWNECNCAVVWTFFDVAVGIGMKTDLLQSCGHCWVFQHCWHIEERSSDPTRDWTRLACECPGVSAGGVG